MATNTGPNGVKEDTTNGPFIFVHHANTTVTPELTIPCKDDKENQRNCKWSEQ